MCRHCQSLCVSSVVCRDRVSCVGYADGRTRVEEIVTDNGKNHVCPFHATRDLMAGGGTRDEGWASGLILLTYQQLINACVREASGADRVIDDAIIVVVRA